MNNDQEWRAHMLTEIRDVRKEVGEVKSAITALKTKVATISSIVGAFAGFIINKFFH
jgi:hypothetical protein